MRKTLLTLALVCSLPALASAQQSWTFESVFPPDSSLATDGNGVHGIAVDPDGKVWIQPFGGSVSVTLVDTIAIGTTKIKTRSLPSIHVYNADGTEADFSPITFLERSGSVVDTLGLRYIGPVEIEGRSYPQFAQLAGVGLRTSPADGHILVAQGDMLYRLNYQTGELMNVARPYGDGASLTAPGVDGAGNVYVATVVRSDARPIKLYSPELQESNAALISGIAGFSRSFDVSLDGNTVFWSGYTTHGIHMYQRESEFDDFPVAPDTVIRGVDSESVTLDPDRGLIWVSAGSPNDMPNRNPGLETNFQPQTWYAFNWMDLSEETPNPAIQDSLKWTGGGIGRPRGLAFSPDGEIAYIAQFSQGSPAVQKLVKGEGNAVAPIGEVVDGFTLKGNYPNPVSGKTNFEFSLPTAGHVTLKIYDALGREIATVVDEMLPAESYRADFDASMLPSGVYLYRLTAGTRALTGTMTVVR